ncbi:MAG: hypothetical protein K8T20_18985 [Planctomycetes bacterium]|nr:hypothetical protein [Planctomycetota bacterium]
MGRFLFAFLAAALAGCAPRLVEVHDEPRVASDAEKLVVESSVKNEGKLVLQVFREREIVTEQQYWLQRKAEIPGVRLLMAMSPADAQVASTNWDGLISPEGVYVVFLVAFYVPIICVSEIVHGVEFLANVLPFDEQRTVVRNATTSRKRSYSATIERADGSRRVLLGKQPDAGYVLDSNTIDLFGGPGEVVFRDGELSAHFNLERPH